MRAFFVVCREVAEGQKFLGELAVTGLRIQFDHIYYIKIYRLALIFIRS